MRLGCQNEFMAVCTTHEVQYHEPYHCRALVQGHTNCVIIVHIRHTCIMYIYITGFDALLRNALFLCPAACCNARIFKIHLKGPVLVSGGGLSPSSHPTAQPPSHLASRPATQPPSHLAPYCVGPCILPALKVT